MSELVTIKNDLWQFAEPEKAKILQRFFKAIPGGYGEGDRFIGVKVPFQRKIAGKYYKIIPPEETAKLLRDPFHECRLTALFILCLQFEKGVILSKTSSICFFAKTLSYDAPHYAPLCHRKI